MDKNMACSVKTKKKMAQALKVLMEEAPFEKITVSDITDKCGIHRQTFYYHFNDRYELLDWMIYTELVEPFVDGFSLDNMYEKFFNMLTTMYTDKRFYKKAIKISTADLSTYINSIAKDEFIDVIKSLGKSTNIIKTEQTDDEIIAEFFGYGISGVVLNWAQRGMKESPREMTDKIQDLVEICKQISYNRQNIQR